ncbi:MAG: hypothetical protein OXH15_10395 [Gammaproteobacteria bacterium]|nr:hypothetical protein [Gammaproteobacteria bacterium]
MVAAEADGIIYVDRPDYSPDNLLRSRNARVGRLCDITERIAALSRREALRNALACVDYDNFLRRLPGAA